MTQIEITEEDLTEKEQLLIEDIADEIGDLKYHLKEALSIIDYPDTHDPEFLEARIRFLVRLMNTIRGWPEI